LGHTPRSKNGTKIFMKDSCAMRSCKNTGFFNSSASSSCFWNHVSCTAYQLKGKELQKQQDKFSSFSLGYLNSLPVLLSLFFPLFRFSPFIFLFTWGLNILSKSNPHSPIAQTEGSAANFLNSSIVVSLHVFASCGCTPTVQLNT
jgi:hypothetical protein